MTLMIMVTTLKICTWGITLIDTVPVLFPYKLSKS
ncbi:hypothetical protein FHR99_003247 [Litorivivens lipolytica]|uniref:Uncharacterized protein n=1 Tax=Litorivivens lipolytica TaxID=1524264 RepID=A0A7W4W8J9_9GAMM|nr:hypothetical protein [Litorivivens lipolytica]